MNEEWRRIKSIAIGAWDTPPDARQAFLDEACRGDAVLRHEVESLLRGGDAEDSLFDRGALAVRSAMAAVAGAVATNGPGARIGPYRILRELGRGGMGQVFLAERVEGGFDQRVAIKFISGVPDRALIERFNDERRILATLAHPNITRLLDGGTTREGLHYVVMEFVDGVPITAYCDRHSLGIRERLELFRVVCGAVQYAHQRLIVHRDIKPGNILVGDDGVPKLLDFGIAKLLDPALRESTTLLRAHTPESASPEQVRGEPITIATDVYSLGVLLYRLLTGVSPYGEMSSGGMDMVHAVCETTPPVPSAVSREIATNAGSERIATDLDRIVMHALRKEPERRYASVDQFSADVQRYLDGRPVSAMPDSRSYRLRKFATRHRAGIATTAAFVAAALGGVLAIAQEAGVARRERARAEARFEDVRQLANAFVNDVHDGIQYLPGSTAVQKILINRVVEYLTRLADGSDPDSSLQLERALAFVKIGDVQGNPYYANVGDAASALASYRRALAILDAMGSTAQWPDRMLARATVLQRLGDMRWADGDNRAAVDLYSRALEIRTAHRTGRSLTAAEIGDLAFAHYSLAQSLARLDDTGTALDHYRTAQQLYASAGDDPRQFIATMKLGDISRQEGRLSEAIAYHGQAVADLQAFVARFPDNKRMLRSKFFALVRLAEDQTAVDDPASAVANAEQAVALAVPVADADPTNVQLALDVAYSRRVLGAALASTRRFREALLLVERSTVTLESLLAADANYIESLREAALAWGVRGDVLAAIHRDIDARASYARARTLLDRPTLRSDTNTDVVALRRRIAAPQPAPLRDAR